MSEVDRKQIHSFGSYRLVKVSYDFSAPSFIVDHCSLDSLHNESWTMVGILTHDDKDSWIYKVFESLDS